MDAGREGKAGLGLQAADLGQHVGEILAIDAADLLQGREILPCHEMEMGEQGLHGRIEPIALLELDRRGIRRGCVRRFRTARRSGSAAAQLRSSAGATWRRAAISARSSVRYPASSRLWIRCSPMLRSRGSAVARSSCASRWPARLVARASVASISGLSSLWPEPAGCPEEAGTASLRDGGGPGTIRGPAASARCLARRKSARLGTGASAGVSPSCRSGLRSSSAST